MGTILAILIQLLLCVTVVLSHEPHLEVMPKDLNKKVGENIGIRCAANVSDPSSVKEMQWFSPDGVRIEPRNIMSDTNSPIYVQSGGQGILFLYLFDLQERHSGDYKCTAVYADNINLEATTGIHTIIGITFMDTPLEQNAILGNEYLVKCMVKANPPPEVAWMKDSEVFQSNERRIIQQNGVLIKNITEADEGVYTCMATVILQGSAKRKNIQLNVFVHPSIVTSPEDVAGIELETATFHCAASGKPAPTYTWVDKDGLPLKDREGYYVDSINGDLTILSLNHGQAGTYRCMAENRVGTVQAEANLRVLMKPKLEELLNITADVEKEMELKCLFSGDPLPEIIFQKKSNPNPFIDGINEDGRIVVSHHVNDRGQKVGVMKISSLERSDDGLYSCTGRSGGGVTVGWGHITAQFPPTFENQHTNEFWTKDQHKVNLTCETASIPNATIQWYIRNREIPSTDLNLKVLSLGPVGVLQVTPLDNSYFGTYTCQATNILGTQKHDVTLKVVRKPSTITSLSVEKKTARTITWNIMVPTDDGGRPITTIVVEYWMEGDHGNPKSATWVTGSSYTLDNLNPNTRYNFKFAARNEVDLSEWSGVKSETMNDIGPPESPMILARDEPVIEIPFPDKYSLQWRVPIDNGSPIDKFTIRYYQVVGKVDEWKKIGTHTERVLEFEGKTMYDLKGLRPDTHYKIEVRAHNGIGQSLPSEIVIKTANDPNATTTPGKDGRRHSDSASSAPAPTHNKHHTTNTLLALTCFTTPLMRTNALLYTFAVLSLSYLMML